MPSVNGIIEIGKNCIKYSNDMIKISNISKTSIFMFQNREKRAYEERKRAYEREKASYEIEVSRKKKEKMNIYIIATIVILLVSLLAFSSNTTMGAILLIVAIVCGLLAYTESKKDVFYHLPPPQEENHPDKYGLSIEMNSGSTVYFTAIGKDGAQSLRKLQNEINDADTQQEITIFNMNDNRITVENNDGVISTGDNAENNIENQ